MLAAAALAAAVLSWGAPQDATPSAPAPVAEPVSCAAGPLERAYGGLTWLVFGCSNGSVVFGGKPGTLAETSMFMWARSADGFEFTLETSLADTAPLAAAQAELGAMTLADLQALVAEASGGMAH